MSEHTKTPWEVNTEAGPQIREVFSGDTLICDCGVSGLEPIETEENTRFIVRACNAHEALLEACKNLVDMDDRDKRGDPDYTCTDSGRETLFDFARSAIKLAEGSSL